MQLSDRAVAWLRALDAAVVAPADAATTAVALAATARLTPAWREPHLAALARLAATLDAHDRPDAAGIVRALTARVAGHDGSPLPADVHDLVGAAPGGEAWAVAVEAGGADASTAWADLAAAPLAPCAQVVGVDVPAVVLRRAEWWRDSLFVGLAPADPDAAARTEFRLVGGEPRMWCIAGIDDVMTDVSAHGMSVRLPRVAGELVFTPGSY